MIINYYFFSKVSLKTKLKKDRKNEVEWKKKKLT